ncbi:MAG TPA: 4Fe-4S binding protein [Myxococcota bacterium]|nr:4Fe-4S binding protein [Myxococcota bacterium]
MYAILDGCDRCGMCVVECAVDAIEKGKDTNRILPERCTSCGACVPVCPLGVIVAVPPPGRDARPKDGRGT